MRIRIAVVYEAEADFKTATELADRVFIDAIDWLDEDHLPDQREWKAEVAGARLTWTGIKQLAREAGIRAQGHFDGESGFPDAAAARRAILYLFKELPDLTAIVLIRDRDNQPDRRAGLEQARAQDKSGKTIVLGLATVERECWVLSGFEPQNDNELARLAVERTALSFDPRLRSHELTACKDDNALRSPKRVLQSLVAADWLREQKCWTDAPLDRLRERGRENGLAAYLNEIRDRLAPLIGHVSQR